MAIQEEPAGDATSPYVANPQERVVALCERFSQEQARGPAPSIAAFLELVDEDSRAALLRNLLSLEIDSRQAGGDQPQIDEYLSRFPAFASIVREILLESAAKSSVEAAETEPPPGAVAARESFSIDPSRPLSMNAVGCVVAPVGLTIAARLGPYKLLGELGRGGMGVVYEAVHVRHGNHVALKTLPSMDGKALHAFKREFRALSGVNHPNLIGLQQLEADGGQWFFTMDLVEGSTFLEYVRPDRVLDEARLRQCLTQFVAGVMALHGQHIVHRDLKPSNVMVTHEGRVVILDFGVVFELNAAVSVSKSTIGIAGTPRYMSPEQSAGRKVTSASDWYAVGVMLFEALTGRAPFTGSMVKVFQDKQTLDPPAITDPNAPEDLAELCLRLLARYPDDRPDARDIVRVIASGAFNPTPSHAGHSLVGRETQLRALDDAYKTFLREKEPMTLFVRGRSGEGKTALADRFLAGARADKRTAIMAGRCYDRESVPFKALDTLIDALGTHLLSIPAEDAALVVPDDIGMLVRVFPALQRVGVIEKASDKRITQLDETQIRKRAFSALRSLLTRLGRRLPIIWFVDDLQWGDADSAEALFEVLRPPEAPSVWFIGTYRSDETDGSAFLAKWKEMQALSGVDFADREVSVGPLNEAQGVELVVNVVGRDNDTIRQRAAEFVRETQGNAFLLTELAGCFDPESDSFESIPLHEVLARKLERLPAEAGPLLEMICVSGQALDLGEAARTIGFDQPPMATITRMRNERLIRLLGDDETPKVDTYHDRVRETVLREIKDSNRADLHRRFAEMIERESRVDFSCMETDFLTNHLASKRTSIPRIYDLAFHFEMAGDSRKTFVYSLAGAEQAKRSSALEVARNNYATAKRHLEAQASPATQYRLSEGYALVLMKMGDYEKAKLELANALDLFEDPETKARIELTLGILALSQGDTKKSIDYYDSALMRLGIWVPSATKIIFLTAFVEFVIQSWHSLLPGRLHKKNVTSKIELTSNLLWRECQAVSFSNTPKLLWGSLKTMNFSELHETTPVLAIAYAVHGLFGTMLGFQSRGEKYIGLADEIAKTSDDIAIQGFLGAYMSIGMTAGARYEQGLINSTRAMEAFEKIGDPWEANLNRFHRGCCHFGLGELTNAVDDARRTVESSVRLGDSRVFCASYLWARATRGNFPFESLRVCFPNRPDDVMSTVHGVMAEGHWHSFHGRTAEGLEKFDWAAKRVRQSGCVNSHMIVTVPELARALRLHADAVAVTDQKAAWKLRKRAWKVGKWAIRFSWMFPAIRPHAWRERALILDAYGKTKKALKAATKSCAIAESQKAKYEHAQSLLVCGQLAKKMGHADAEETTRRAEAAIEEMERPVREMNVSGGKSRPIKDGR